jgi:hypothetical protein
VTDPTCPKCAADPTVTPGLCECRAAPASGRLIEAKPVRRINLKDVYDEIWDHRSCLTERAEASAYTIHYSRYAGQIEALDWVLSRLARIGEKKEG